MTAKEYVKNVFPKAKSERQVTNGGEVYWLIRPNTHLMYISNGNTQSSAWVIAKKKLIANSLPI